MSYYASPIERYLQYLPKSNELCERYLTGQCYHGKHCLWRHPDDETSSRKGGSHEDDLLRPGKRETSGLAVAPPAVGKLQLPEHMEDGRSSVRLLFVTTRFVLTDQQGSTSPAHTPLLTDDAVLPDGQICYDFLRGRCYREHCKYPHAVPRKLSQAREIFYDIPTILS